MLSPRGSIEIIGVTAPVKFHGVSDPPLPMFFLPLTQDPRDGITVHLRLSRGLDAAAPMLRQRLREFDRLLFAPAVLPYPEAIARRTLPERFATALVGTAGVLALFLAALGVYGVLSHAVSQSTREIGIRLAVGASRSDVFRHVLGRAAWLFAPGAAIGVIGGFLFSLLLEKWLYGIAPHDPLSMLAALSLLVMVAGLAAWLPTRRALRIHPMEALRYQ